MCFVFQMFFCSIRFAPAATPWRVLSGRRTGVLLVLGFACGSFASVGREASQEAGQACLWCPEAESNHRHEDFQSSALPTELSGHK